MIGKHPAKLAIAGSGITTNTIDSKGSLVHTFDVVADCTGSKTGLATALELVRPCGTVVLKTTVAGDYTVNLASIVIDEIRVIGSRCGPFPEAIAALAEGRIDVRPLIQAGFPLDQAEDAFIVAGVKGARKVLLEVSSRQN